MASVSDDFNGFSDGDYLDSSANWNSNLTSGNRMRADRHSDTDDGTLVMDGSGMMNQQYAIYQTALDSEDHEVSLDCFPDSTADNAVGVCARFSSASDYSNPTCYRARFATASGGSVQLTRVVNGVSTSLGSWAGYSPDTTSVYDLKLICDGSTISVEVDGTERISVTDTVITDGDYGGIYFHRQVANTNGQPWVDNWAAADLGGGGTVRSYTGTSTSSVTATGTYTARSNRSYTGTSTSPVTATGTYTARSNRSYTGALTAAVAAAASYTVTHPYTGTSTSSVTATGVYTSGATSSYTGALTVAVAAAASYTVTHPYNATSPVTVTAAASYTVQGTSGLSGTLSAPVDASGVYTARSNRSYTGSLEVPAVGAASYTVEGAVAYTGTMAAPVTFRAVLGTFTPTVRTYRGDLVAGAGGAGVYAVRERHAYTGTTDAGAVFVLDRRSVTLSGTDLELRIEVEYPLVLGRSMGDDDMGDGLIGDTPTAGAVTWQSIADRVLGIEIVRGSSDGSRISPTEQWVMYVRDDDLTVYPFTHLGDVETPHMNAGDPVRVVLGGETLATHRLERFVDLQDTAAHRVLEVYAFGAQYEAAFETDIPAVAYGTNVDDEFLTALTLIPRGGTAAPWEAFDPASMPDVDAQESASLIGWLDALAATGRGMYDSDRLGRHRVRFWPFYSTVHGDTYPTTTGNGLAGTITDERDDTAGHLLATNIRWLADTDAVLNTARSQNIGTDRFDAATSEYVDTNSRNTVGAMSNRLGFPAAVVNRAQVTQDAFVEAAVERFADQVNRPAEIEFDTERDPRWATFLQDLDTGAAVIVRRDGYSAQTEYRCVVHGYRLNIETVRPGEARIRGVLWCQTLESTI